MHSGLLASIGLAGLLFASPALATDASCCQDMKADKPPCCDMPCCKDNKDHKDHKNHAPAMALPEADVTEIFLMTMQTVPPVPPVVVAKPGTPTIR